VTLCEFVETHGVAVAAGVDTGVGVGDGPTGIGPPPGGGGGGGAGVGVPYNVNVCVSEPVYVNVSPDAAGFGFGVGVVAAAGVVVGRTPGVELLPPPPQATRAKRVNGGTTVHRLGKRRILNVVRNLHEMKYPRRVPGYACAYCGKKSRNSPTRRTRSRVM
jgi:hypothetical protein